MRTLSRHLLLRQLTLFASALLAFFAVGSVVEILVHLDEIVEQRRAAGGVLPCLVLRVATRYAGDALPAASFAATFLCVALAARAGETTALRACGVAPRRLAGLLLGTACGLSLATLALNETWLLDARRALATLESASSTDSGAGPFWYHSGNALYNVGTWDGRPGGGLRDVAVFELDLRGRLVGAVRADRARDLGAVWKLEAPRQYAFDPRSPDRTGSSEPPIGASIAAVPLRPASAAGPGSASLGLAELWERGRGEGPHAARHRADFRLRLAQPFGVLLFALAALPLGLRTERTHRLAGPALLGAAALAGFHAVDASVAFATRQAWVAAGLGAWLAPALLVLGAVFALARPAR